MIKRIAKPRDDEASEFEELESMLRSVEARELKGELLTSLLPYEVFKAPDPTKDPLLTIEAFVIMAKEDSWKFLEN